MVLKYRGLFMVTMTPEGHDPSHLRDSTHPANADSRYAYTADRAAMLSADGRGRTDRSGADRNGTDRAARVQHITNIMLGCSALSGMIFIMTIAWLPWTGVFLVLGIPWFVTTFSTGVEHIHAAVDSIAELIDE